MKLYKIAGAPAGERFHSAKTGLKDFEEIDIPKDGRAGMAKFLNDNEAELGARAIATPLGGAPTEIGGEATAEQIERRPSMYGADPLEAAEMRAVAASQGGTTVSDHARPITTTDIERFILNDASVAQVEDIFAALGARFKELANGR